MPRELPIEREDFLTYHRFAPAALAIRECIRLSVVREYDLPSPILDVGCGDGIFARMAYPERQTWGIDVDPVEVRRAQRTAAYDTLICGSVVDVDLPEGFFGSAIANCSLEHVPDLDGALRNIRPTLKAGAPFILIVPTPDWTEHLAVAEVLRRIGLPGPAKAYGEALDRVFKHVHLYGLDEWSRRLEAAGYEVVETRRLVAKSTSRAFDLLMYPSFGAYLIKRFTGRWVLLPGLRSLSSRLLHRVTQALTYLGSDDLELGAGEWLIVARPRTAADR
jgi:SAM-dependent methyltransferase